MCQVDGFTTERVQSDATDSSKMPRPTAIVVPRASAASPGEILSKGNWI